MNPDENPLPDYYAALQVHPEAEAEVVRAAYRQLMKKYHPDNLPPKLRQDLEVLKRVRLINLAYDVLSDPALRVAYDAVLQQQAKKPSLLNTQGLETRIHLVRCARSQNTYKMLLARRAGSMGAFLVTGFELIEESASKLLDGPQNSHQLALPDGRKVNRLRILLERALPVTKTQALPNMPHPQFPSQSELQDLFNTSNSLNFSDIAWSGFDCPSCHTGFHLPNGKNTTWCHCSTCSRIYCSGNLHNTPMGVYGHCPWCGRLAKITRIIQPGESVDMPVRGEVGRSEGTLPKLKDITRPQLPNQKKE